MKSFSLLSSALAAASLFGGASAAVTTVDPIVIKGQHFFYKTNGTEFFIRGVAYQQDVGSNGTIATGAGASYTDPLADPSACKRDIPYLAELRTNVIRVYAVDPTLNHDECMSMLADAGIYVISDLTEPDLSINRDDPQWNYNLYNRYTAVIDMFSKYTNVIGFFAGNEVSNEPNVTAASAFVKAAVRDSKAYIREQGYENYGVGYATYDGPIREELANYFACGSSEDAIDFWGYNIYSWCGDSTFQASSYQARTQEFSTYPVPVFFAEYGCNAVEPRTFTDVPVLFGPQMDGVWSGGIVYMYFQEQNDFGLVIVNGNTVTKRQDFINYSSQMAKISPASTKMADYNPTGLSTPSCPSVNSVWQAAATPLPPTPNQDLCNCMYESLDCVVASGLAQTKYKNIFNYICGNDPHACTGIATDAEAGHYGSYSGCAAEQQLGFVMNQYYLHEAKAVDACSFAGAASLVAGSSPTGSCSSLIAEAGSNGAGQVAQPTGSHSAYVGPSGAADASTGASTSTGAAASSVSLPSGDVALFSMAVYIFGAFLTGAGMIFL